MNILDPFCPAQEPRSLVNHALPIPIGYGPEPCPLRLPGFQAGEIS